MFVAHHQLYPLFSKSSINTAAFIIHSISSSIVLKGLIYMHTSTLLLCYAISIWARKYKTEHRFIFNYSQNCFTANDMHRFHVDRTMNWYCTIKRMRSIFLWIILKAISNSDTDIYSFLNIKSKFPHKPHNCIHKSDIIKITIHRIHFRNKQVKIITRRNAAQYNKKCKIHTFYHMG